MNSLYTTQLWAGSATLALLTAALFFVREKRNSSRWYLLAGMAMLCLEQLFSMLSGRANTIEQMRTWQTWRLGAAILSPGVWLCFSLSYARENSREFLVKWTPAIIMMLGLPILLTCAGGGEFVTLPKLSPKTHSWTFDLRVAGVGLYWVLLVGSLLVLMNLERTFRAAVGMTRWRVKYMLLGLGLLFGAHAYAAGDVLLSGAISFQNQIVEGSALLVAALLMGRSLLRGESGTLQVYPSTTLLLRSATALLACLYLLLVGILANVLAFSTRNRVFVLESVLVIVACAFLGAMLLSERARNYVRRLVTRHLHRPQYDYRGVWQSFVETTSKPMEQSELCDSVAKLVASTFQALTAGVWLLDDRKQVLTSWASTTGLKATPILLPASDKDDKASLQRLQEAVELQATEAGWARTLLQHNLPQFRDSGTCLCAPLIVRGELAGVITVTDRVGALSFTFEEKELLKAMADQAAACLLSIRLAQKQAQNKQLEAFQTMSAFFVHDLKNTASSLSLMLQNFQAHYDNPAFRKDAMTGIDKTVNHINDLVGRLKLLRHGLTLQPVDADLNEVVADSLTGFYPAENNAVSHELRPIPKVRMDPEKMRNVVTNLVLNAREAIGPEGRIHIETAEQNGYAVLGVRDNGCGMSPDFVKRGLFRPFQSTKKNGVGIGMFQCKMIVEAHRGRIEVETEPGKGTAFRVLLPIANGI